LLGADKIYGCFSGSKPAPAASGVTGIRAKPELSSALNNVVLRARERSTTMGDQITGVEADWVVRVGRGDRSVGW
jgi:hypothetical protein